MGASILYAFGKGVPRKLLKNLFCIDSAHFFHDWKSFRGSPSRVPFWRFIRSCQNPIGRAQPKNWNLWLSHMIWALCWKCDRILLRWGIYLNQSYKEGTREGAWDCVFIIEMLVVAKNSQKLTKKNCEKRENRHETANVASKWAGNQHGDLFFKVLFENIGTGA